VCSAHDAFAGTGAFHSQSARFVHAEQDGVQFTVDATLAIGTV
jgi:hypothetical protein